MSPSSLRQANVAGKWAASRRLYFTGAAIALLLDTLMPGWHSRLAEGGWSMQGADGGYKVKFG